jgi:ABC-type multidrug transport system fused ATPase/permease subunit
MSATATMGEAWELYKRHWRHLLPVAFVVFVLLSLLTLLLAWLMGAFGQILGALVTLAGTFWIQGALVVAVDDVRDGRADLTLGETLSRVRPRLNTLALAGLLAALGIGVGLLLLIVPGLVLATWWLFIVPVIMLEGAGVMDSFGRSRELGRGHGWSVFALLLLTLLVQIAGQIVVNLFAVPLRDSIQGYVASVVATTILAPYVAAAWTLGYYRLREGRSVAQPAVL